MKTIKIYMLIFFITAISNAQEDFKYSLKGIKKVTITTGTSVKIIVGTSNELIIGNYDDCDECDDEHNHNDHDDEYEKNQDKAKGLKAIYSGGVDNTGHGIRIEKEGDVLKIRDLKSFMQRHGFQITLPKNIDISLNCGNLGHAKIIGFSSDIEVKTNVGHIDLIDVTGPITASSSVGNIEASFISVNQNAPISIRTSTGNVDLSLPVNTKANLELKSTMGTVYTNFDLEIPKKDGMSVVGSNRRINSKLNSGGVKITLSSSIGNVYLRKKK